MANFDNDESETKRIANILEFFRNHGSYGISPLSERVILPMLEHMLPFYFYVVKSDFLFTPIHRATVNKRVLGANKRIHELKYLKYPPSNKVSNYGRCNLRNQSVLYASTYEMIATSEAMPEIGDLVTHSKWELNEDYALTYCPIFRNQPTNNTTNPRTNETDDEYLRHISKYQDNVRSMIDLFVQFVADSFSKRVNPGNPLDYIFSAYFADKVFNHLEQGSIEAIYYPSVRHRLAFENIAIKPDVFDKRYHLVEVRDSVIVNVQRTSGGYIGAGLSDCKQFDYTSDKILWDKNKLYTIPGQLLDFNLKYGVTLE